MVSISEFFVFSLFMFSFFCFCHVFVFVSFFGLFLFQVLVNKDIGDAGSTADLRMLWSAIVCLGLGLL